MVMSEDREKLIDQLERLQHLQQLVLDDIANTEEILEKMK